MAYQYDERDSRYGGPTDGDLSERDINVDDRVVVVDQPLDETTPDQLTADVNNFSLADAILTRFSANGARTITGFAGAKSGIKIIAFIGANSLILPNESASSDAQNRILTHSGASITLTDGQLAIMTYDLTSSRWRAGELT